jgi:hypothetical protein
MTFAAVVLMAAIGAEISQPALAGAGELDPTFGISGRVVLPAGPTTNGYAYANALLVQPDARIVMAGYNYPDGSSVYRLMPNGDLDVTFGAGGPRTRDTAYSTRLAPDGNLWWAAAHTPAPRGVRLSPECRWHSRHERKQRHRDRRSAFGPAVPTLASCCSPDGKVIATALPTPEFRHQRDCAGALPA